MNGIPAGIAGVERRVMVTPPDRQGRVNPALLVAAAKIGIHEIYKAGSAWAIAALAYGTASIPPVDVIVGPGNQYVAEAKRQVSGRVRIDMIAGPSEVLIIADEIRQSRLYRRRHAGPGRARPHGPGHAGHHRSKLAAGWWSNWKGNCRSLVVRRSPASRLRERGVILIAETWKEMVEIANDFAAEHLELMVADPFEMVTHIRHAGAIFLGNHSPESTGDYLAGPNHVLPTMGTARFSSALGVETFVKKSSLISYTREALLADSPHIQRLANLEGLSAHARSASIRTDDEQ